MTTDAYLKQDGSFDWRAYFADNPSPIQKRARAAGTSVLHQFHSRNAELYEAAGDFENARAAQRHADATR